MKEYQFVCRDIRLLYQFRRGMVLTIADAVHRGCPWGNGKTLLLIPRNSVFETVTCPQEVGGIWEFV